MDELFKRFLEEEGIVVDKFTKCDYLFGNVYPRYMKWLVDNG